MRESEKRAVTFEEHWWLFPILRLTFLESSSKFRKFGFKKMMGIFFRFDGSSGPMWGVSLIIKRSFVQDFPVSHHHHIRSNSVNKVNHRSQVRPIGQYNMWTRSHIFIHSIPTLWCVHNNHTAHCIFSVLKRCWCRKTSHTFHSSNFQLQSKGYCRFCHSRLLLYISMYVVRPSPDHPDHLDWSKEYQEGRGKIRFVYLICFDSTCLFIFLVSSPFIILLCQSVFLNNLKRGLF